MNLICPANVTFSSDNAYSSEVRAHYGPDEFFLTLEGPEVASLSADVVYKGGCVYEMPYGVTVPGRYHIQAVFTREWCCPTLTPNPLALDRKL